MNNEWPGQSPAWCEYWNRKPASGAEILGQAIFPEPLLPPPCSGRSPRTLPDGRRAGEESECVDGTELCLWQSPRPLPPL